MSSTQRKGVNQKKVEGRQRKKLIRAGSSESRGGQSIMSKKKITTNHSTYQKKYKNNQILLWPSSYSMAASTFNIENYVNLTYLVAKL